MIFPWTFVARNNNAMTLPRRKGVRVGLLGEEVKPGFEKKKEEVGARIYISLLRRRETLSWLREFYLYLAGEHVEWI